jgi:hypothetical protein
MKKIKLKLRKKIKKIFNLYDINDLVIGGHCGCCGNYISDEIFEKDWSWGMCRECREL